MYTSTGLIVTKIQKLWVPVLKEFIILQEDTPMSKLETTGKFALTCPEAQTVL